VPAEVMMDSLNASKRASVSSAYAGSRTMLVLEMVRPASSGIFACSMKEYGRAQVLALLRSRAPAADPAHPLTHSLIGHRDLNAVDPEVDASRSPAFLLRAGCIVVALPPLRAIITRCEVLVFIEEGADNDLGKLLEFAQNPLSYHTGDAGHAGEGPLSPALVTFEYAGLAALLKLVDETSTREFEAERAAVEEVLKKRSTAVEVQFQRVQETEDKVTDYAASTTGTHGVVEAVLDTQQDMAALVLSHPRTVLSEAVPAGLPSDFDLSGERIAHMQSGKSAPPSPGTNTIRSGSSYIRRVGTARVRSALSAGGEEEGEGDIENPAWREDLVRMEELLEWFTASTAHRLARTSLLRSALGGERKRISMSLAAHRNQLMRLQIGIAAVTMSMGGCSMISGWYGMNLDNGFCGPEGCRETAAAQGNVQWLTLVSVSSALAFIIASIVTLHVFRF
jgi:hypothetical protein